MGSHVSVDDALRLLHTPTGHVLDTVSDLVRPYVAHSALMLLTDDASRPAWRTGSAAPAGAIGLNELTALRDAFEVATTGRGAVAIGGITHAVWCARADTGALLLLVDPAANVRPDAEEGALAIWRVAAQLLNRVAHEAEPPFLRRSRVAAALRAQLIDELTDVHAATIDSLLAVLRSARLDDRVARQDATRLAVDSAIRLRTSTDHLRTFNEEPVTTAFERLRADLAPLVRYRGLDVQFVEPPVDGRALPAEIAHGARAVVRGAVLALAEQAEVRRVRVQWDCDGTNLLVDLRDDGPGALSLDDAVMQSLRDRVTAMLGTVALSTTAGWGTELAVVIPLDPPRRAGASDLPMQLSERQTEVLDLMLRGVRNRAIADQLGISANTVKYHVSGILRTFGASSRAEAIALALGSGGAAAQGASAQRPASSRAMGIRNGEQET